MPSRCNDIQCDNLNISGSGTIRAGSLNVGGGITATGPINTGSGGLVSAPVVLNAATIAALPGDTLTLSHATHSGRTIIVPNGAADMTLQLPDPTAVGQHYHFIYGGILADATNCIIRTVSNDNSVTFTGSINWNLLTPNDNSEDGQDVAFNLPVIGGATSEILTLINPAVIDVHFLSISLTQWCMWGNTTSDTIATLTT